tara:strand:+ start:98 stop:394 length:297 start_codon:yes stop_codon:yes gene_type:complete
LQNARQDRQASSLKQTPQEAPQTGRVLIRQLVGEVIFILIFYMMDGKMPMMGLRKSCNAAIRVAQKGESVSVQQAIPSNLLPSHVTMQAPKSVIHQHM